MVSGWRCGVGGCICKTGVQGEAQDGGTNVGRKGKTMAVKLKTERHFHLLENGQRPEVRAEDWALGYSTAGS